jgi:hypothetical protein
MLDLRRSFILILSTVLLDFALLEGANADGPTHVRGQITAVQPAAIEVRTNDGKTLRLGLSDATTILTLAPASYADVEFGVYVGSVSERMDERYSPIYRDSLSWLHKGLELRVVDEKLRGIALGHQKWDLTPESVMTHGWVDDQEERVISIKYGPTEEEETDVEVGRDIPILKLSLGERQQLVPDAHVFAGAAKGADGNDVALFIMVGLNGVVPRL